MAGNKKIDVTTENITGPQKAAIFLLSMGEEYSSEAFQKMTDYEIRQVASTMSELGEIPPEVFGLVVDEFNEMFEDKDRFDIQGETFIRSVIERVMDKDAAEAIFKEIEDRRRELPFVWSRNVDVTMLAGVLREEHPQTVAMVLAHLPTEIASEILSTVPDENKGDLAIRIAKLGRIPEEIVRDVDQALRAGLSELGGAGAKAGGLQTLVDIINMLDKASEDIIMETIDEEDNEMATDVRSMMFVFEDLLRADDKAMREILKKVESATLVMAMKTGSEDLKQKIMSNLSARAAEMLMEDLEVMGPVRLAEVEEAQQEVITAAKELEADGTISLGGKGKDDVLV